MSVSWPVIGQIKNPEFSLVDTDTVLPPETFLMLCCLLHSYHRHGPMAKLKIFEFLEFYFTIKSNHTFISLLTFYVYKNVNF